LTIQVLDLAREIPQEAICHATDSQDGLALFTFVAYSDDAALAPLIVNLAPGLGGVSVEHTHPAQAFLMPFKDKDKNRVKGAAIGSWKDMEVATNKGACRVG